MDDSSNGRAVALYPGDLGSNPRSDSVWDHFVSATGIDGYIMSDNSFYPYIFPILLYTVLILDNYEAPRSRKYSW